MSARVWPRKASSGKPAEGWGTKEVVKFLKLHDLRPYVSAAKRAKVKGHHLLAASLPQPALTEHGEAFVRLCQALGVTSLLDQGRLRRSLLHLRPASSTPLPRASFSLPFDDLPADARQQREQATRTDFRYTSSSATVDEVPKSPASAEMAQPLVRSASFEAVIAPTTTSNQSRAQIAPTKSSSCPTKLPRSHTAPPRDGSPTPTPRPLCWSAPDVAARHNGGRTRRLQEAQYRQLREMPLSLAYASLFGTIAVKCVLRRSGSAGASPRNLLHERSRPYEETEGRDDDDEGEDDVSFLLLDAHRPLRYADLLSEIERVHGPLAAAEGGEAGVRVRYEDKDGDVVNVHSDDSLRYAYSDWLARVDTEPTKSWRLLIDLRQPPASASATTTPL